MSKIRLSGSNSGYVEIAAAADAGNLTFTMPTTGTALFGNGNNVISGITTFSAALDINSSIDVSGTSVFNNDVTFDGTTSGYDAVWNRSQNSLQFADHAKATFGNGSDLEIYHNGIESWIKNNTSTLNFLNDGTTQIKNNADNQTVAQFVTGNTSGSSGCHLFFGNSEKFYTTDTGTVTNGICTATSFSGDGSSLTNLGQLSYRNLLINGDFVIFQRYLPGSMITVNSGNNVYCMDRWYGRGESSKGVFTFHQHDITSQAQGTHAAARVNITTTSTPSTNDVYKIAQRIEGRHIDHLAFGTSAAKTLELSFITKSSVTGTHSGALTNSGQGRSFPFTYTISNADTWEQKSITIPGDTGGTWDVGTGIGMELIFDMGTAESNYRRPANSWYAGRAEGADGAVQLITQSGANWYVTKVQLEIGNTATSFEHFTYPEELARCQRYYYQHVRGDNKVMGVSVGYQTNDLFLMIYPKVTMRAAPSLVQETGTNYYRAYNNGGYDMFNSWGNTWNTHENMFCLNANASQGVGLGGGGGSPQMIITSQPGAYVAFNAEL